MTKFRAALASSLIGLFVLTGCGGGEEVATTDGGEAPVKAPFS